MTIPGSAPGRYYVAGMIKALVLGTFVLLFATFPATWLLMIFLGNVGLALSYWATLPLGILVSLLLSGSVSGHTLVVNER